MSEDTSDTDSSCEWTFVSRDGKPVEGIAVDEEDGVPCPKVPTEEISLALCSKDELDLLSERNDAASSSPLDETCRSDSSSDIEKIDDPFNLLDGGDFNPLLEKSQSPLTDDVLGRSLSKCFNMISSDNEHFWEKPLLTESVISKTSKSTEMEFDQIFWEKSLLTESATSKSSKSMEIEFDQVINKTDNLTEEGNLTRSDCINSSVATDINNLMDNLLSDCCKCDDLHSFSDNGSNIELGNQLEDAQPLVAEDFSDKSSIVSNQELPVDLNEDKLRTYRHTPNQRVNFVLNILVLLVVATVVGIGFGHFIGLSQRWLHQKQAQNNYATKMRMFQTDITNCLQQALSTTEEGKVQPCFEHLELWKLQLQEFVGQDKDQDQAAVMDQDHHPSVGEDFRTLQMDFLYKQLEYIEAIKEFKQKQTVENKVRQKVKDLEEENSDLKIKLEKEEVGDAEDQKIMFMLMKENAKLKLTIDEMQEKVHDEETLTASETSKVEMGTLREQINQLTIENEDLRSMIARIRYASPPNTDLPVDIQNSINKLKTENMELRVEIGKLRYTKPTINIDTIVKPPVFVEPPQQQEIPISPDSSSKPFSSFAWIEKELYGIFHDGHEVAKKLLNKTVAEYKKLKNNEALWGQINSKVDGVFNFLNSKWERLQKSVPFCQSGHDPDATFENIPREKYTPDKEQGDSMNAGKNVLNKFMNMFTLFKKTCKDLGNKVTEFSYLRKKEQQPSQKPGKVEDTLTTDHEDHFEEAFKNFNFQYEDTVDGLKYEENDKLEDIEERFGCVGDDCEKTIDDSEGNVDWVFQRAWYRENKKLQAKAAEWLFDRARDREEQRDHPYLLKSDSLENEDTPIIDVDSIDKHPKGDWYFKAKFHGASDHVHKWDEEDDDFDDNLFDDYGNDDKSFLKSKSKFPKKDNWHPRTKYGYGSQSEFSDHKFHSKANGKPKSKNKSKKGKYCMPTKHGKPLDSDCFNYS